MKVRKLISIMLVFVFAITAFAIPAEAVRTTKIRVVVNGVVSEYSVQNKNDEWYMKAADITKALGIKKPAGKTSGYVSLDEAAKQADIYYECDSVLNAAYFWTDEPYGDEDFMLAFDLGLVSGSYKAKRDKYITSTEFRKMLTKLIKRVNKSKVKEFQKNVTSYKKTLLGGEAVGMAYYAAKAIGADIVSYPFDRSVAEEAAGGAEKFWDDNPFSFKKLFPNFYTDQTVYADEKCNARTAAYLWLFWFGSGYTGTQIIPFDWATKSFHLTENVKYRTAISMLARIYSSIPKDSEKAVYISTANKKAVTADVLTKTLLTKAAKKSKLKIDDLPQLTGFVIGWDYNTSEIPATVEDLKNISQWGFNSVRLNLTYQTLFNEDATKINATNFNRLDTLVAASVKYDLHLNILFQTLPGRWAKNGSDFKSKGCFELFVNKEYQKQAQEVMRVLSERYADIPGAYLSFTPFWEPFNKNLSTGLPHPDYSWDDMTGVLTTLVKTIRTSDPDRFVIYEASAVTSLYDMFNYSFGDKTYALMEKNFDNILFSCNFAEEPYIYQEMTAVEGAHVDFHNHGMFKQDYPTYIYTAAREIIDNKPITIDGFLPQDTELQVYLLNASEDSSIDISAVGKRLYSESFSEKHFDQTTSELSRHYRYAESEKLISVKLPAKASKITVSGTGRIEICGMNVILPDQYSVEKLYYPSAYDIFNGDESPDEPYLKKTSTVMISPNSVDNESGRHITIKSDITFISDKLYESSDAKTIAAWLKTFNKTFPKAVIRIEHAWFNIGTNEKSRVKYYEDFIKQAGSYGYGWYSNDFLFYMTGCYFRDQKNAQALGIIGKNYKRYYLDTELLKVFRKYQCNERV